ANEAVVEALSVSAASCTDPTTAAPHGARSTRNDSRPATIFASSRSRPTTRIPCTCRATASWFRKTVARRFVRSRALWCTCYDGTITITASGGVAGLFYSIDGIDYSNTTGIFTGLAPGIYPISVMNSNDCIHNWPDIIITEPTLLVIDDVIIDDVMGCYGDHTGIITVMASGGTPDYIYSIDAGNTWQVSNIFSNLPSANYEVVVKDTHDCITPWDMDAFVSEPELLAILDIDIVQITSCYGDLSGEIHISATGGTGNISYSIDGGNSWYQNDGHFTGLAAGYYFIQIHDMNGCENIIDTPFAITQPPILVIRDVFATDVSLCYGYANGIIDVNALGGTGNLQYSVDGGNTFLNNGGVFQNLVAGSYEVFVRDANGCIVEYSNNPIVLDEPIQITMDLVLKHVSGCFGDNSGSISIDAVGGTGVYSYSIDGGLNWTNNSDFLGLVAGSYEVMTQDDNGCIQAYENNPVVLLQPDDISVENLTLNPPICYGDGGEIYITAYGGTGALHYSIDGGLNYQTDAHFTDVLAGEYNLLIKDDNDCELVYENNPIIFEEPEELIITEVVSTDITCDGVLGTIVIDAHGGTGELLYSINNGASYQSINTFINLLSDTYIIKVKDAYGCAKYSADNPVVIHAFNSFSLDVSVVDIDGCYGDLTGEIHMDADGGDGELSYSIDNGANWFQNNGDFIELAAGTYQLLIKDENDCEFGIEDDIVLTQPDELIIEEVSRAKSINCYGDADGRIEVFASGGTGTIFYSIDNGATYHNNSGLFENLVAGEYYITVLDENACYNEYADNPVVINEPTPMTMRVTKADNSGCEDHGNGYIYISASGGTGDYVYSIDGGQTYVSSAIFANLETA
ncbi:MAG: hypothetical protein GQ527_02215, partial [Bacteroidales bacterium]|nr:hypothetical protein [Bacteroidales bacterium]